MAKKFDLALTKQDFPIFVAGWKLKAINNERAKAQNPCCQKRLSGYIEAMVRPEEICEEEWAQWYGLTPLERWHESQKLWDVYLKMGGTLDPESDTQSPFYDAGEERSGASDGRPGMHLLRRGGV